MIVQWNNSDFKRKICAESAHGELSRQELEQLEQLDDTIFAAIDGDPIALDSSATTWQLAVEHLGPELVEESRQQYLRRAEQEWNRLHKQPGHAPHKTFAALEILDILGEEL